MHRIVIDSPVGPITVTGDGAAVTAVTIARSGESPRIDQPGPSNPVLTRAAAQLREYFAGERIDFDLPLAPAGTAFQQAIWDRLRAIPHGTAVSYGRVAADVGLAPAASRAVGTAVGANPITIIIPCHRVLAADGRITGYSGGDGIPTKQRLLDLEGIPYR